MALIEGESDPERLAALGSTSPALHGFVREHHRFMLQLHLAQVDALDRAIKDVEERTEALLKPFRGVVDHVETIPGISALTAAVIVAEIGVDMSRFPTADHLISWAGLCPGQDESAGKHRLQRLGPGAQWLTTTLVQAAWKRKDSYFHAKFVRIKRRRGAKKAAIAVAASMLTAACHMIERDEDFLDLGSGYFDRFHRDRLARRFSHRLHAALLVLFSWEEPKAPRHART